MPSRILRDERDLEAWSAFLRAQAFPMTVSQAKGAKRSNPQNSTLHAWFSQIAAETGQTPAEAKGEIKLRFGLPIMQTENAAWIAEWMPLYGPLSYAQRLKLFEVIPLTSKLTTRQMAALMDAVQREYRAQGIPLIDPDARKYEQDLGPVR